MRKRKPAPLEPDINDWTEDDWKMLFLGIEALKRKIARAQAKRKETTNAEPDKLTGDLEANAGQDG